MKNSKVLILVPAVTARGGITNYYHVLKNEFPENVEYFERGARTWPIRKGMLGEILRAYRDYLSFKNRLSRNDIVLVQTTTSLGLNSIIRDGLFLRYANKKNLKTIAFFRGWDEKAERDTEQKYLWLFKHLFFRADCILVLSERVKTTLTKWGYKKDIYVETTLVDKKLLSDIDESFIIDKFNKLAISKNINILFLSRVERRKGIYELLQAYTRLLNEKDNQYTFHLTICGDGSELENIKRVIDREKIANVNVSGFVEGQSKKDAFTNAHIFVFPSYGEGMPNAVLEAMGFGLPVITTPVGGVVDIFTPHNNGDFIKINSADDIYHKINFLIGNQAKLLDMALNNYKLASNLFRSDRVMQRMETIFSKILS